MLFAGVAAALWGGRFCPPDADIELTSPKTARRFVWYAVLALVGGVLWDCSQCRS